MYVTRNICNTDNALISNMDNGRYTYVAHIFSYYIRTFVLPICNMKIQDYRLTWRDAKYIALGVGEEEFRRENPYTYMDRISKND